MEVVVVLLEPLGRYFISVFHLSGADVDSEIFVAPIDGNRDF